VILRALTTWKECLEAAKVLEPGILIDGIDLQERAAIRRECEEATVAIHKLLRVI